jgi:PadR family transcriptional regulator AphA
MSINPIYLINSYFIMSPRPALPLQCELALLGLVRRGPVHGYELLQILNASDGLSGIWRIKIGQIYAYLNKLEDQGYLTSSRHPQSDYPARRLYAITPAGESAFLEWMRTPVSTARDLRQLFQLKLYFKDGVPSTTMTRLIADQVALCRSWLERLERERDGATGWRRSVTAYRVELVQASLHWLETLPSTLLSSEATQ